MSWFGHIEDRQKLEESEAAANAVREHLATKEEMERQVRELDEKLKPLALNLAALREAGIGCTAEREELRVLKGQRDGIRQVWMDRLDELRRVAERLTFDRILEYHQGVLEEIKRLPKEERLMQKVEVGRSGKSGAPIYEVTANTAAIVAIQNVLLQSIHDIRKLQHSSLAEVERFIADTKAKVNTMSLQSMVRIEMTASEVADLEPKPETPKFDTGFVHPRGGVMLKDSHVVDDKLAGRLIDDRVESLKAKLGRM